MGLFVVEETHTLCGLFRVFLLHFSCDWVLELNDHVHLDREREGGEREREGEIKRVAISPPRQLIYL